MISKFTHYTLSPLWFYFCINDLTLFFGQFSSMMTCFKLCHSFIYIKLLLLQQQTGVGQGSYITPFTSTYQQPPPPAAQQQQQTQQLYITTNYQQSSVPTVLLQPTASQQVIIVHVFVKVLKLSFHLE